MSPADRAYVLPVDKPGGPTSHDIVQVARKSLGERRIGHTGTLDPFASGLLLLCMGRATRLAEYLTGLDKTYRATALLGVTTDTDDLEGEVLDRSDAWRSLSEDDVAKALAALRGTIDQVPPQFSAKKVGGEAMYRRARRGEQVDLAASRVEIHEIEITEIGLPEVTFRVRCSSGTYVRSLARDLGSALGVGAHLTSLRRTAVGRFDVSDALSVEELSRPEAVDRAAIEPLEALAHLPKVEVDADAARRITHGQRVRVEGASDAELLAVASGGALLAVAGVEAGMLRPAKVFA